MQGNLEPKQNRFHTFMATKKGKIIFYSSLGVLLIFVMAAVLFLISYFCDKKTPPSTTGEQEPYTQEENLTGGERTPVDSGDELRGVYIATTLNINFPSKPGLSEGQLKKELNAIVETSRSTGFDTIYFQVRPSGDALYQSRVFPTSRYLVENEGDSISFDPLSYLISRAAEYDMDVVAWVNPYRITNFTSKTKEAALACLAQTNPARIHPDWTVFYGGKLYYNPALPEVQDLIVSGLEELCSGYDVKGILFDDYFYPYPVNGETFDDADAFSKNGDGKSLGDWRRNNVNEMVKKSFDAIKSIDPELNFGISPFGIWKNASSDPMGSDTRGMEAYSSLYCDALAWIRGGYIDYIAPQIYWERGYSAADFATLTRWWSAQVDGTGVGLCISHAAYKVGEFSEGADEIVQQILYARNYMGSFGNIQYGFADIQNNTAGIRDALKELYNDPYEEDVYVSGVQGVQFARPQNGLRTTTSAQFVSASSDPAYPVYSSFGKVGRTKSGFFSILMPLQKGRNTLTLTQNGKSYSLTLTRMDSPGADKLPSFQIQSFTPTRSEQGVLALSGSDIPVTVTAPAGSMVTASLNGNTVKLSPTIRPTGSGILKEVYIGSLSAPVVEQGSDYVSYGTVTFTCTKDGKKAVATGPSVLVIPENLPVIARVERDYSFLKISPYSSFYEDYTPTTVGMTDRVTGFFDGYYRLSFGGYVSRDDVTIEKGKALSDAALVGIRSEKGDKELSFVLSLGEGSPPLSAKINGEKISLTLYRTHLSMDGQPHLPENNRLFQSIQLSSDERSQTVTLSFSLISRDNYYGFRYCYEQGGILLSFRLPQSLSPGDQPLAGKTVLVDAGHGGKDVGALGFLDGINEEDLNFRVVLSLRDALESLGANVILSRSDDTTVSLYERMDLLTQTSPDLAISIHHNSTAESYDANSTKGTLGLFWSPAGRSLIQSVQQSVCHALHSYDLGSEPQELAVCRNHRFPQALLEVSFICSPAEYQRALRQDYATTVANATVDGILDWYRMQEGYLTGEHT